jgi:hypothetical protein
VPPLDSASAFSISFRFQQRPLGSWRVQIGTALGRGCDVSPSCSSARLDGERCVVGGSNVEGSTERVWRRAIRVNVCRDWSGRERDVLPPNMLDGQEVVKVVSWANSRVHATVSGSASCPREAHHPPTRSETPVGCVEGGRNRTTSLTQHQVF